MATIENPKNVSGSAQVFGSAQVSGSAWVFGSAQVSGSAWVFGSAQVSGSARVFGSAWVFGSALVSDFAQVYGSARVSGSALVSDFAQVYGSARVSGSALVSGSARIASTRDYITIGPIGSRDSTLTAWRDLNGTWCNTGCFTGSLEDFEKLVKATYPRGPHRTEYMAAIAIIKARAETWVPITDAERKGGAA